MPHHKVLRFCLFSLCLFFSFPGVFSAAVSAQSLGEAHSKILSALEKRDYAAAANELRNLENSDKKMFALNNYDYLLARTAEKQGDYATAAAYYETVVTRDSVLSEYALLHLAQIARSSGNLMLERIHLRQIQTLAPNSLLNRETAARLLRSHYESKDFGAVISIHRSANIAPENTADKAVPKSRIQNPESEDRETLVYVGQSLLQLGRTNEARDVFTRLITILPNSAQPDDFALAAARALDETEVGAENFGKTAPKLTDAEHYKRAQIYQFNRDFANARLHYAAIIKNFPQSAFAPDAMYQTARGYTQELNFEEAINWFERVQAEFPDQPIARDALSQAASAYARVNKPREALVRYQKFIEKYPDADNLDRAYLNIVDVKRDTGEETEALNWTQKTRERFKGKLSEALALFAQARIRITQNDWRGAVNDLNELQTFADLGGARVPGGTNQAEVTFLKGFALENLERYAEATDVYLSIPDGRNEYYGWRATDRLKAMADAEKSKPFVDVRLSRSLKIIQDASNSSDFSHYREIQNVLRLTNNAELRRAMLEKLRAAYAVVSNSSAMNYKIPEFKLLELGRREVLKERKQVQTDYHRTLADELLFLGLYDEAAPELEASEKGKKGNSETEKKEGEAAETNADNPKSKIQNPKSKDFAYTLAVLYRRGDMAYRAVSFVEPLWRNVPADYQIELMPRAHVELLYPTPFADALLKYAPEKNIDARFLLSIMRQESRFRADVKSNAAARGLMQFISTTSDKIATGLNRTNFRQEELYNPPTAIEFGAQYLADLFKMFPAQPAAVAASYNGGETNVARWQARSKSGDPDRYVPEIVFTQSKDYVYKVMANYRVYQTLYDDRLNGNW